MSNEKIKKIFRLPVKLIQEGYMEIYATDIEDAIEKIKNEKIRDMMNEMVGPDSHFIVPNSDGYYELNGNEDDFIESYKHSIATDNEKNGSHALCYDFSNFYKYDEEGDGVIVEIFRYDYTKQLKKPEQLSIDYIGTIDMDNYDKNKAWEICNWSAWSDEKPENLHACISGCSIDVIFHPKNTDIYDIALGIGWKRVNRLSQVQRHFIDSYRCFKEKVSEE